MSACEGATRNARPLPEGGPAPGKHSTTSAGSLARWGLPRPLSSGQQRSPTSLAAPHSLSPWEGRPFQPTAGGRSWGRQDTTSWCHLAPTFCPHSSHTPQPGGRHGHPRLAPTFQNLRLSAPMRLLSQGARAASQAWRCPQPPLPQFTCVPAKLVLLQTPLDHPVRCTVAEGTMVQKPL